jgi:hypothetical protein
MRADKLGSSFAVTRTAEAEQLLEAAASKEVVELSELGLETLLASQGHALFKKRKLAARIELFNGSGEASRCIVSECWSRLIRIMRTL